MDKEKAFVNVKHNGIHFWFPHGNGISTVWGTGTYSENHDYREGKIPFGYNTFLESNNVEIMILKCPNKLLKKIEKKYNDGSQQPIGYLNIKKWLEIINMLSK